MSMNLDDLFKDGFNFDPEGDESIDLALISLRSGIKAYFATYRNCKQDLRRYSKAKAIGASGAEHDNEYAELCTACIVHFHHFAELVCKALLRCDHPLLSDIASGSPDIVHKLLHREKLTTEEEAGVRSIEFSDALKRVVKLVGDKKLKGHEDAQFIIKHHKFLTKLGNLRNRVLHRGLFILRYRALDAVIGGHALAFAKEALQHPLYRNNQHIALHGNLACAVEPINEIVDHFAKEKYDIAKVAFLKELGRAAYANPIAYRGKPNAVVEKFIPRIYKPAQRRAEKMAAIVAQYGEKVELCPVCGVKSMIIFEDMESYPSREDEDVEEVVRFTTSAECMNCSFELYAPDVGNASDYGISNIPEFWWESH
jgi:hypothetical protein